MEFDVLYLADLRFPGGTSTSLRYDLRACRTAGLKAGIIPVSSPIFARNRVLNQTLLAEIRATGTVIVPRDERPKAKIALLNHPSILENRVRTRTGFDAETCCMVVHQPTRNRRGQPYYKADQWPDLAADWFGHDLHLLPVSNVVRNDLVANGLSAMLHEANWPNLIDPSDFPQKPPREAGLPLVIGRHSRPSLDKWPSPEIALSCYPESPVYSFRMLGAPQEYLDQFETLPWNWHVLPFSHEPVSGFLQGLDIYSYFHSDTWIEAFGYSVLEALATGLPCVVPHGMEEIYADACFYADPTQAPQVYERLRSNRSLMEKASQRARAHVEARFGLDGFKTKFGAVAGRPGPLRRKRAGSPAPAKTSAPVVLTVTSNGIGLGHLSRQLAIAKALGPRVNVVFFSLSEAIEIARSMGYAAEYRPFHRKLQADIEAWNAYFFQELREALGHYNPALTLFDGNLPYGGLVDALESYGKCTTAWIRRGLWRTPQPQSIARERVFDAVFEPGELCEALDPGYSRPDPDGVARVNPVLMTQPRHLFSRNTARRALDLPEDATLCLVQLGSEANFDMSLPRQLLLEFLERHPHVIAVEVRSPLHAGNSAGLHERLIMRKMYPLGQALKAFDFAVCAAGYNTFHENIAAGLPSLFVPNSAPEMDVQEARADYGARSGWSLTCSADDPFAFETALEQMLDPDLRQDLSAACLRKTGCWDGAWQIARQLQVLAQLPENLLPEH